MKVIPKKQKRGQDQTLKPAISIGANVLTTFVLVAVLKQCWAASDATSRDARLNLNFTRASKFVRIVIYLK